MTVPEPFEAWQGSTFGGAKIALICNDKLLVYRRDDKPGIPHPNMWDLPGGGREGEESPVDCAMRETYEEFGIIIPRERVEWQRRYVSREDSGVIGWFLAAKLAEDEIAEIRFGDEGQHWAVMEVVAFLGCSDAVTHLQYRLSDYIAWKTKNGRTGRMGDIRAS